MSHIISLLSGNIPGGIVLALLALLFVNLTLHFLVKSGLIKQRLREKYALFNTVVLLLYSLVWFITRDAPPLERIVVLPTIEQDSSLVMPVPFTFAHLFAENAAQVKSGYMIHPWYWIYQTLQKDHDKAKPWMELARRLNPSFILHSQKRSSGKIYIVLEDMNNGRRWEREYEGEGWAEKAFRDISREFDWFKKMTPVQNIERRATLYYRLADKDYDSVIAETETDTSNILLVLRAEAFVGRGLQKDVDYVKKAYVDEVNADFEQAKSLLIPLIKMRRDVYPASYLLGRMAIRDQDYENAEVYLKKALTDNPYDARIYFALSYLLSSRLEELGLENRKDVLRRAIRLDPGYTDAVYELANEYFMSGSGIENSSGSQSAFNVLHTYLKINHKDPRILSLLASIDLKLSKLEEAEEIYLQLAERFPQDSNAWYNLGILYSAKKEYDKAIENFEKAIRLNDNPDAYLHLGIIYQKTGDFDKALYYFRERVKRKDGEDDRYAREALKGIRKVLAARRDSSRTGVVPAP
ncbi:MAG TPA: tetratricopeptide repeat protein [Caldithrix abyssi]|uniref:Tetratricopeptide repeat protein n=1 Tax=Caldithrix abyssi TaxID=187145 RepID=A0A7V1LM81_CALAY|nr:tetratricopeptide repeat protein [Caldithrix abyssi]